MGKEWRGLGNLAQKECLNLELETLLAITFVLNRGEVLTWRFFVVELELLYNFLRVNLNLSMRTIN